MKKTFVLVVLAAALGLSGFNANNNYRIANAYDGTGAGAWTLSSGDIKIEATETGTQMSGKLAFGARAYYNYPVNLDGLTFDFEVINPENFCQYGFYFSKDPGLYFAGEIPTENNTVFTMTVGAGDSTAQTSLYIRRNHDFNGVGEINLSEPRNDATPGFHAASRLVMNTFEGKMGLRFHFSNYDDNFLKLEVTEMYQEQIWGDNFNYVKDGEYATVTTYLRKDYASLNGLETYIHFYGMVNEGTGIANFNQFSDSNIVAAEQFADHILNNLVCDPTGIATPDVEQWNALKSEYEGLSKTAKMYLASGASGLGETIKAALEKYDYIVNKYDEGYEDFLSRRTTQASNGTNSIIDKQLIIVACLGVIAVSLVGGALAFIKKRKETR